MRSTPRWRMCGTGSCTCGPGTGRSVIRRRFVEGAGRRSEVRGPRSKGIPFATAVCPSQPSDIGPWTSDLQLQLDMTLFTTYGNHMSESFKTTVYLDAADYRRLKALARAQGRT